MTKEYNCELCKKVFNQKIDFTRHTNKKTSCISIDKMQSLTQTKYAKTENKINLSNVFNYCVDVLRNNEYLTGDKALRTLAHLLDLRLLEPQFGKQIDIDDYAYDFSAYDDSIAEQHKAKLLKLVRFSNLVKEKEDNIPKIMKCLWDEILSVHPITKNIFLKGKGFDIQHQSTYKKIINKLYTFDFEATDEDILGEAYEEVIKDVMIGKTLGQFFTPPKVKQMMVNLIDPQLKPDGTIETIFDPAMGTGGFLITCLRNLLKKSKSQNIPLNWDFISHQGLGGRETEADTYQLAVSNMLIASGKMFKVLEKGNSIHDPITNKYDIILANPPFGIDGLTYTEIMHPLRNEYMPISSNSAVPLFVQAIIHMLKINGRCAMVLPEGQDLFSKNKTLVAVREYLMKTCDLKEVIYLPAGTFTHTPTKTCVFYFHKKKNGNDVLETILKYSKTTQKETDRTYVFSKMHQTHKVKFYDYNTENDTKHLLLEVAIDDIAKHDYSLNYAEYLKDETMDGVYEDGVVVKLLGEVCSIIKGEKKRSKDGKDHGLYPLYYCSILGNLYLDTFDYTGEGIIINKTNGSGKAMVYYGSDKYNVGETTLHFKSKINELITKYVYYYLLNNIELLQKYFKGANQKSIVEEDLFKIKIPIPPLDRQQEIVKYLDFIYERSIKTSREKMLELKQLNEFCLNTQKVFGENNVQMLGEVCEVNPETMKAGKYTSINYIDIASVKEGILLEVKTLTSDFPSRAKRVIKQGDILYSSVRPNLKGYVFIDNVIENAIGSTGFAHIRVKDKNAVLPKFIYYMLTLESILEVLVRKAKGAQYPAVSFTDFETLKIPIPSIEHQKEIVEYCEFNDKLIQQLEKEVEQNKKQANLFISAIVKTAGGVSLVENELVEEAPPTPIVEEGPNVEEEAVAVVEEAPKPKKLVKKIKLKVVATSEE